MGLIHNFLKHGLIERLGIEAKDQPTFDMTRNGSKLQYTNKYDKVEVIIQSMAFKVDLFVMCIEKIDIVLRV